MDFIPLESTDEPIPPQFEKPYAPWLTKTLLQVTTESEKENTNENKGNGCDEIFKKAFTLALEASG